MARVSGAGKRHARLRRRSRKALDTANADDSPLAAEARTGDCKTLKKRVQQPCRRWDQIGIKRKAPKQVLVDVAQGRAVELYGLSDARQVAGHQHDIRRVNCGICT